MRASLSLTTTLLLAFALPALAGMPASPGDVLELAKQRFSAPDAAIVERALSFVGTTPGAPSSEAQPRGLVVARSLLLDDEAVRPEVVASAILIGNDATVQAISHGVGAGVAWRVRELRKPGLLPNCAASSPAEAAANLESVSSDLQRVAVYAHVDALRPGRRPDLALNCIRDTRAGLLPALRGTNPVLAESLDEDVAHLERRYSSELSGEALLTEFRRRDGTLDWRRLPAKQKEMFTLDLFLRELVAVVNTGDRQRMEQFFAGLAGTDFFEHYGAFALGGKIVNARYLSRYMKPQFVEELMRSNVNLVLGQHVSQIARGEIQAHVFSVSLTSLGLSAATVRAGMTALGFARRVQAMKGVQTAKHLARLSRFEAISGWFYVIAETAVVVYVSEWKNQWLQERAAQRRAKGGLLDASKALFRALSEVDGTLTLDVLDERVRAYQLSWSSYREFLLRPVFLAEQRASEALASLAEEGKRLDDKRRAILSRLQAYPGLVRMISRDHGTLDRYAGTSLRSAEAKLTAKLELRVGELLEEREAMLREVYAAKRRKGDYLSGADDLRWHVQQLGRDGAPGDPGANRNALTAYSKRSTSRMSFKTRLHGLTRNRLQTYEDEEEVLRIVSRYVQARPELQGLVSAALSETQRAAELDRTLASPR